MKVFSAAILMGLSMVILTLFWASSLQAASNAPVEPQRIERPIAVTQNQRGYNIYAMEPISGKLITALNIDTATVATVGVPAETTLLASSVNPLTGAAINVYRLNSGEFRVDTLDIHDKMYSVIWDEQGNMFTHLQ